VINLNQLQLINHGVDPLLVENVKIGTEEFFNLPMQEKKKFWQTTQDMEGFGQVYVALEEDKLRWGDMFYVKTLPLHRRHPKLIPFIPQPFRYCVFHFFSTIDFSIR
jgi:isopenicillin N synthase-like dioxygenase